MKKILIAFLTTSALVIVIHAQSLSDIISKNIAARGGIKNIKAIKTERLTGHISFGDKNGGLFTVTIQRREKMREEFSLKGKTIIRVLNKNSGWILNPFNVKNELQSLPPALIKDMKDGADLDGPLVDYKLKGNEIKLLGKDTIEGKITYKLMVKQKDGDIRYDYIDSVSGLELMWKGKIGTNKNGHTVESYFRNFKSVNGIMFAFEIDSETLGTPDKQKIIFDKVEVNPILDKSIFSKPAIKDSVSAN
ncbi:MAG: outer membrane lipoprotein-sorting protein [Bacteroidetes bacterium]|nr:outer membrane lipoprotein-sorting protein [Bacteroidota bacterium]